MQETRLVDDRKARVDREGEGDHEQCPNPIRPSLALEGQDGDGYEQGDAREAIREPERDLLSDIGDRAGPAIGGPGVVKSLVHAP
jgi:hypothetical protein